MDLTISGHNLEVTPAMRAYVLSRLRRVLRHFDGAVSIDITFTAERRKHKAKGCRQKTCTKIVIPGNTLHVVARSGDAYVAVDSMMDRLDRQIRQFNKDDRRGRARASRKPIFH